MVVTMNFDCMGRRTLYLKRDYLDVKLHYEDNLPPFIPLQSKLEKLWSDWQKAKMDLSDAQMEMVKCKLKNDIHVICSIYWKSPIYLCQSA